jgi:hypothetical protein
MTGFARPDTRGGVATNTWASTAPFEEVLGNPQTLHEKKN